MTVSVKPFRVQDDRSQTDLDKVSLSLGLPSPLQVGDELGIPLPSSLI